MKKYKVDKKLTELSTIFKENGFSLYLVGGAVRDFLLEKNNFDFDFTTDATPEDIIKIFPKKTIPTGIKHGTVTLLFKGDQYEITTFRADGDYEDGRHPETVSFVQDLNTDLVRRDFTINAFAVNLENGKIIDICDGEKDLKEGIIRAIGNPFDRFNEDALRMMRAIRFSSQLGFSIEENTLNAISSLKENILKVSPERIKVELFKLIDGKDAANAIETMRITGLLQLILPELDDCYGVMQGGYHKDTDVYHHSVKALKAATEMNYSLTVKIAALLHDIGKPSTKAFKTETSFSFHRHEIVGSQMVETILKRLKCSNKEVEDITLLVREHMFHYESEWTDSALRRFIKRVGMEYVPFVIELNTCDNVALNGKYSLSRIQELRSRIDAEVNTPFSVKDLAINGKDLMEIGISPGPKLGSTLNYLLDRVVDAPSLNNLETLKKIAREYDSSLQ